MSTRDISPEYVSTHFARIGGNNYVTFLLDETVGTPQIPLRVSEILIVLRADGTRLPARWMGQANDGSGSIEDVSLIERLELDPSGEPIGRQVDAANTTGKHHDWGALGLPDGLDSRVVPLAESSAFDHLAAADASAGSREVEASVTLGLAPGDSVLHMGAAAEIMAIDRRAGTVDVRAEGGIITVSLDDAIARVE